MIRGVNHVACPFEWKRLEEDGRDPVGLIASRVLGMNLVVAPPARAGAVVHEPQVPHLRYRIDHDADRTMEGRKWAGELGCPYSRIPVDRERLEMERRLVGSPDGIRRVGIAQDTSRPRFPVPTGSVAVKLEDDSGATTRPVLRNRCDGSLHHDVVSGFQMLNREHLGDRSGPKNLPRRERGDDDGDRREESDQLPAASSWACGRGASRRSLHGLTDDTEGRKLLAIAVRHDAGSRQSRDGMNSREAPTSRECSL